MWRSMTVIALLHAVAMLWMLRSIPEMGLLMAMAAGGSPVALWVWHGYRARQTARPLARGMVERGYEYLPSGKWARA